MSVLGLNEHHQATVLSYMRFARYQCSQRLRSVDRCFEDLKNSRLNEDTFTLDEVVEMIDGLLTVVRGEVESELIHTSHTNTLLLRQVFLQAEKWHLKLQADISELENRELLEQIKDFEEAEMAGAKTQLKVMSTARLEPLNQNSATALLELEIKRLTEENIRLRERMQGVETQAVNVTRDKHTLQSELEVVRSDLDQAKNRKAGYDPQEVTKLQSQIETLKVSLGEDAEAVRKRSARLEGDLTESKHELLKITEMLELAEKDLEKKVGQTTPFKNLKMMLAKKNSQIKELRVKLAKHEPSEGDDPKTE